jgi:hypothetical protein
VKTGQAPARALIVATQDGETRTSPVITP